MSTRHQRWILPHFGADWETKGWFWQPSFRTAPGAWVYLIDAVTYLLLSHFGERLGADIQAMHPSQPGALLEIQPHRLHSQSTTSEQPQYRALCYQ